jgi:hypothetical protein
MENLAWNVAPGATISRKTGPAFLEEARGPRGSSPLRDTLSPRGASLHEIGEESSVTKRRVPWPEAAIFKSEGRGAKDVGEDRRLDLAASLPGAPYRGWTSHRSSGQEAGPESALRRRPSQPSRQRSGVAAA